MAVFIRDHATRRAQVSLDFHELSLEALELLARLTLRLRADRARITRLAETSATLPTAYLKRGAAANGVASC